MTSLQIGMHWFPEREGGLNRVYYELSSVLPTVDVAVSGLVVGGPNVSVQTNGRISAFSSQESPLLLCLIRVRTIFSKTILERQPDIIVSHFALYTLPILDRLGRQPFVLHFHSSWAEEGSSGRNRFRCAVKRWVKNMVYQCAARAIMLSNAFAELLADRYHFPKDRIGIIPGGITVKHFAVTGTRDQARRRLGWPRGRPTVVTVCRLVPRMGPKNLLAAFKIIKRNIPNILVMIAGRGRLQPQLATQIEKLGLAGTPCLVSPVGGLPEVVTALSPNLVMRSPAVADIAAAIEEALQGRLHLPDDLQCRAYATKNFDWQIIASETRRFTG